MIKKLDGRFIDDLNRVVMTSDGLANLIIEQRSISGLLAEECDDTIKYNKYSHNLSNDGLIIYTNEIAKQTAEEFDSNATLSWKTPKKYQITDEELAIWLFERCSVDNEYDRVLLELNMYEERGLYSLLKHLIYLVDHFRKNDVVWGVGRGSSCSSYILYLIGIHKVDPIKYDLNIEDFLK